MGLDRRNLYIASQWVLLGVALAGAVVSSRAADWRPLELLILLLVLGVVGERLAVTVGNQSLSASFIALVLAMTLLGPAPAALIGGLAVLVDSGMRRPPRIQVLTNLATYLACLVSGAVVARLLVGDVHSGQTTRSVSFVLVVFTVFLLTNVLNFLLIAVNKNVLEARGLRAQARTLLLPMLPGQLAAALLDSMLAAAYAHLGYPILLVVVVVILIFQYLAVALLRSEDRAEQLAAHSSRLATLQLGVLVTLVETLQLRDPSTARHAAAVARFARALARAMDRSEREQDLVHSAGLLHDIGKFALPDRILHADSLTDDDLSLVRRHPQEGATLVGRLDGYGPVSDIILYHHEQFDGQGYPAGLIANEIPLLSRVVAVCNVYDVLTARDSYRPPRTPQEAIVELRQSAGRQLDPDVVTAFISMLEREGGVTFAHGDAADFEAELDFERRTRALAQPS